MTVRARLLLTRSPTGHDSSYIMITVGEVGEKTGSNGDVVVEENDEGALDS